MNYAKLQELKGRLYFTVADVADLLGITQPSARVLANRYAKKGLFIRLKNNFYVLEQNWGRYSHEDLMKISNLLQVPSYVSFMTALAFYGVTTQVQRGFFENASLKRSRAFDTEGARFVFCKLKKEHYFDFVKKDDIFIATKEKAFIDAVYLKSFGKYEFDADSLDLAKLDRTRIKKVMAAFPAKTKGLVRKLCRI